MTWFLFRSQASGEPGQPPGLRSHRKGSPHCRRLAALATDRPDVGAGSLVIWRSRSNTAPALHAGLCFGRLREPQEFTVPTQPGAAEAAGPHVETTQVSEVWVCVRGRKDLP